MSAAAGTEAAPPRGGLGKVMSLWRRSRWVASRQERLTACPCCGSKDIELSFAKNDLANLLYIDRRLARSDYSLCRTCGTVFAAIRPNAESAAEYYALFPELEDKTHGVYPPPTANSRGKRKTAMEIIVAMEQAHIVRPDMALLHVRCDAGHMLKALRRRYPDCTLYGLDYFPANVRYIREQGYGDADVLNPAALNRLDRSFDIVVCNHIFTHALKPRADLETLIAALKPGGSLVFYNENDHDLVMAKGNEYFARADMINYHKQLFNRLSFENFLRAAGLSPSYVGHRRHTMTFIARRAAAAEPVAIDAAALAARRRLVEGWYRVASRNRFVLPIAKAVRRNPLFGSLAARITKRAKAGEEDEAA